MGLSPSLTLTLTLTNPKPNPNAYPGDRSKIMMVGDRFDTDVRGGVSVGILTCLVESGCHQYKLQPFYPAG